MPQLSRKTYLPALTLGTLALWNCSPATPSTSNCTFQKGPDGSLVCVPNASSGGTTSSDGAGGLPTIGSGGLPVLGAGGLPVLGAGGAAGGSAPLGGNGAGGAPEGSGSATAAGGTDPGAGGSSAGGSNGGGSLGSIQVSAGELARDHSVVTFPFPAGAGKILALKDEQGNQLPLQMSPLGDNDATFVLPSLAASAQATYSIVELSAALPDGVTSATEGQHLFFKQGDKTMFRWVLVPDNFRNRSANNVRSGYIFPLYSPGGLNVADDYAEDHPHMHGVWSAWTSTTFRNHKVDFWNGYANQGHVDLESMEGAWSGAVHGGLVAHMKHTDITTTPNVDVLKEVWIVTVYKTHDAASPYYLIDIDSTQETATSDPLILDQYHYGGFGFRGSEDWAQVGAVQYLTSEGHDRLTGDGQRARWVAQYGAVDGKPAGFAGLAHPTNIRSPQGIRIHNSNPYWCFTASTAAAGGPYTIKPGEPFKSRFRVVSFDGNADGALLERLWADFATPPTVQVLP